MLHFVCTYQSGNLEHRTNLLAFERPHRRVVTCRWDKPDLKFDIWNWIMEQLHSLFGEAVIIKDEMGCRHLKTQILFVPITHLVVPDADSPSCECRRESCGRKECGQMLAPGKRCVWEDWLSDNTAWQNDSSVSDAHKNATHTHLSRKSENELLSVRTQI